MVADDIYSVLFSGVGASWPLVIGDLPATSDTAVAINEYSGAGNTEYFGNTPANTLLRPVVKILVRHSSYATGETWCGSIKNALHRYHSETLPSVVLVGVPMYLGRGESKLHEFQVTFKILIEE